MIADRYHSETWNCTHEVAQWYTLHGYPDAVHSVCPAQWDLTFVRWMRKRFIDIEKPEQGALVLMRNKYVGGYHVGVWDCDMVHHCHQPLDNTPGQAIRSTLALIKSNYVILRYGRYKNE